MHLCILFYQSPLVSSRCLTLPKIYCAMSRTGEETESWGEQCLSSLRAQTAASRSSPAHLYPELKRHSRDYFFFWLLHEHNQWMQILQEEELLLVSFDSMKFNTRIGDFFIPRITLLSMVQVFLLSAKCISTTQLPVLNFKTLLFTCYGNSSSHFSNISHHFRECNLSFEFQSLL